ncbi:uncharacterized protein LOC131180166 [Hevea brasiliensis]|uniref:uncharacterized protein LOC131180166 n=1 Tax=Hevea brasiliensis TaxID=3981 RepID=UPI0025FA2B0F|nr:uncharacterized protein LOC131180166 [Hevea brasiliensis]
MDKLSMKVDSSIGGFSDVEDVGAENMHCINDFPSYGQEFGNEQVDFVGNYNKKLVASSSSKAQGKLPSQLENPREHCKAVILRRGKIVGDEKKDEVEEENNKENEEKNESISNHDEVNEEANKKKKVEKEEEEKYVPPPPYKPPLPYPQRFQKAKLDKQFEKFLEVLKKLYINIPFTDLKDPESFSIPCHIGDTSIDKALCDLGASVSLMPLSICEKLKVGDLKPTTISLQLADKSIKYPIGILENVPLKVGKFFIPVDFMVLEMEEDNHIPIILRRPFLATAGAIIDVKNDEKEAPQVDLKPLPSTLRCAFLGPNSTYPVIISAILSDVQVEKLLRELRAHRKVIGYTIDDIKGISPTLCMHRILLEDNFKATIEHQRRLNPNMKEVVKKEVLKLLEAGIIYPISDSSWVSPVHVVPKKGGVTIVKNENNELIPTRIVIGWRMCIDYRKLNSAIRKDHFSLPFY